MSIVINVLYGNHSLLMGDSRQSICDDTGVRVVSDETQKIFRLTESAAVGFTGNYALSMTLKNDFALGRLGKLQYADEIAAALRDSAQHISGWLPLTAQFVVTGKDSRGRPVSYTVQGSQEYQMLEYRADVNNPVQYIILCNTPYNERFEASLIRAINSSTSADREIRVANCMIEHIKYVAAQNPTVNDKPYLIQMTL